ncbi:restriction endonuclease subunit S [Trueperella pyogenes]|uniref:restriction endonuclease subunit S n=1 Tax=Trueperella pyogenes TaxID=1661 RepID=UPI00345CE7F2
MTRKKTLPLIEDFDNIPAEALVPKDEQPYEIPEHWKWVRIGYAVKATTEKTEDFSARPPYVGLENLIPGGGIGNTASSEEIRSTKTVFSAGQILYGKLRPYLDKHAVADFDGVCSTDILAYIPSPEVNAHYFDFWLSTNIFRNAAVSHSKGINLPRISETAIGNFPFPLPPLEEQQRIVEYIKQTSAKIDDVVQRLEQYLNEAPNRSIKLIQHGVSGELTKSWRQERGCPIDEWESLTLGDAFKWSSGGTPSRKRPEYYKGTIPWIKSGELPDARISDSEEHITEDAVANSSAKLFPPNSVLIAMYGATIGRIGILDRPAATNQAIACAFPSNDTIPEFLALFLRAKKRDFIKLGKGGAQPNISQTVIKAFPFRRPSKEEQELIVETVWNGLAKIEASVELTQRTIDRLTKVREHTILAALSGMLSSRQCGY